MDLSALAPFIDLGATGVLLGLVWYLTRQISSGEWVPRRELDYTRGDRDARLAEKDEQIERERSTSQEWRAAHETSERTRELLNHQVRDAVDALRSTKIFFDTFRARVIDAPHHDRDEEVDPRA